MRPLLTFSSHKSVGTWESDLLHSSSPLIEEQLRSALMGNSERVEALFWRVRGYCEELRKAGILVEQNYAMWIIVNGIRLARFDPLRLQYGLQKLKGGALEYWEMLEAYHDLDRLNMFLPATDSRHPGWSRVSPPLPANAAFGVPQQRKSDGKPGSSKRANEPCTWGPRKNKLTHSEDRCFTKHPELRNAKSVPKVDPIPQHLALPAQLSSKQRASLQAQIESFIQPK